MIGRIQRIVITPGSVCIHRMGQVPRCHETKAVMANRTNTTACATLANFWIAEAIMQDGRRDRTYQFPNRRPAQND